MMRIVLTMDGRIPLYSHVFDISASFAGLPTTLDFGRRGPGPSKSAYALVAVLPDSTGNPKLFHALESLSGIPYV